MLAKAVLLFVQLTLKTTISSCGDRKNPLNCAAAMFRETEAVAITKPRQALCNPTPLAIFNVQSAEEAPVDVQSTCDTSVLSVE